MHHANIFLAHQRVLEARQRASDEREARRSRHAQGPRTLLERIRGDR